GSGTIDGATTLLAGAHLAPGNSPGTITFSDGLTFAAGSIVDFELGAFSDLIRLTGGTLTGPSGTGGVTLNMFDSGGFAAGTYTLFDFATGGVVLADFDLTDFVFGTTIAGFDYSLGFAENTLLLTATASAIPEPSTYAALFGLFAFVFSAWQKRRCG
ncbi:MAG TPA: autotransporter, partial [Opitutus sp.]|nr:autotransporter [Opitutus sp.]